MNLHTFIFVVVLTATYKNVISLILTQVILLYFIPSLYCREFKFLFLLIVLVFVYSFHNSQYIFIIYSKCSKCKRGKRGLHMFTNTATLSNGDTKMH